MEQSLDTKPSGALVAMSVLVLVGCVLLISAAMAMFFVTWDPGSLIAGVILLPLPAALAVQQYRGTFRQSTQAAQMSAVLLFVAGGFALFGFATTLGEMVIERGPIPWAPLMHPMLTIGVTGCLAAWMNLRWSQRLKFYARSAQPRSARTRFSTRELLAAVATIAFTTALIGYFVRSTPPRYAENVTCDMAPFGLPESAKQVSFCQGVRGTIAYEFTIDEDGFVEWVKSGIGSLESQAANVPVESIVGTYTIERYYALTTDLSGPDSITIRNGLYYSWSEEDRGVYAAFDRATGRAYYFAHFH